jgi:hypothetical protein
MIMIEVRFELERSLNLVLIELTVLDDNLNLNNFLFNLKVYRVTVTIVSPVTVTTKVNFCHRHVHGHWPC